MVTVEPYGGAREVGRSAILLKTEKSRILLDYGVKLNGEVEYPHEFEGLVDCIVVSHAHLDHSGYVPHYFEESVTNVFLTPPTYDLSHLLWKDMVKVAKLQGREPPYSRIAISRACKYCLKYGYNEEIPLGAGTSLEFCDAGHIPGSAMVRIYSREATIHYSGDFKIESTRLQLGADLSNVDADILIMETTYGDTIHPPRKEIEKKFVEDVKCTLENGGTVLLPVFAVGRAQEIAEILVSNGITNVYFDGMAREATRIILRHPEYTKNVKYLKKVMKKIKWIRTDRDRKRALSDEECVILSTAGMLQGGPAVTYLLNIRGDPKSKIIFTGYQVEDSPGRSLLENGFIEIDGYRFDVKAKTAFYDFSAHAGKNELLELIERSDPEHVILVHGDADVMEAFSKEVREEGYNVYTPCIGEKIRL